MRFAIGAWPAIAAAIVAHLLFLLSTDASSSTKSAPSAPADTEPTAPAQSESDQRLPPPSVVGSVAPPPLFSTAHLPSSPAVQPLYSGPTDDHIRVQPAAPQRSPVVQTSAPRGASPARDRATAAARRHATRHGQLPTVSELMALAQVARGTAAAALKELRNQPTALQVVKTTDDPRSHP
jgi:hypothetical protein